MSLDYFKEEIRVWAVEHHWRPDQIQYAEDYIDDLRKKGISVAWPSKFNEEKAAYIKAEFLIQSD